MLEICLPIPVFGTKSCLLKQLLAEKKASPKTIRLLYVIIGEDKLGWLKASRQVYVVNKREKKICCRCLDIYPSF